MMKKIVLLAVVLLLSACSQIKQLSSYNVTEAELEQMLRRQVPELTRRATVAGIPLSMQVEQMLVDIGPNNSDVVRLDTTASAALSLFGLSYPASMQLKIEAVPYYDGAAKAIYLRSVKLLSSSIEAAGYRGNLAPVTNEMLQLINGYLANNPVYKLDMNNPTVKLLSAVPLNMAVLDGRLSFSPVKR